MDRLQAQRRQLGSSPEAAIALAAADDIRELSHQLLDEPAEYGYALDMTWRRLQARNSGAWMPGPGSSGPESRFASRLQQQSRQLLERVGARNAIHCVYEVRDGAVVRWTAARSGVRRELLPCSVAALESRVGEVVAALASTAAGSVPLSPDLARKLHELATWLLPEDVLQAQATRLVLISADGFLRQLPFEVLNLSPEAFVPVLSRHDLAYLRYVRGQEPLGSGSALIVS